MSVGVILLLVLLVFLLGGAGWGLRSNNWANAPRTHAGSIGAVVFVIIIVFVLLIFGGM